MRKVKLTPEQREFIRKRRNERTRARLDESIWAWRQLDKRMTLVDREIDAAGKR